MISRFFLVPIFDALLIIMRSVGATFKNRFDEFAESKNPNVSSVGWENIPVDAHYPVLNIPGIPDKATDRTLTKAVIQGSFDYNRRDYANIFSDLVQSLHGT